VSGSLMRLHHVESHAVIADGDVQFTVILMKRHTDMARLRMAHRIRHGFLDDSIAGHGHVRGEA
jgi:hypothetical protein